jgi:hypothetical protein
VEAKEDGAGQPGFQALHREHAFKKKKKKKTQFPLPCYLSTQKAATAFSNW